MTDVLASTQEQLSEALQIQLGLLIDYCYLFDHGRTSAALSMANSLRLLLHENPNRRNPNATCLFSKLGLRQGDWANSALPLNLGNGEELLEAALLVMFVPQMDGRMRAIPKLLVDPIDQLHTLPFDRWWAEDMVAHSEAHGKVTREKLVKTMADKESAHADHQLPVWYWGFRDGEFMSMRGSHSGAAAQPMLGLAPAFIRQIAHEVLLTAQLLRHVQLPRNYHWRPLHCKGSELATVNSPNGEGHKIGPFDTSPRGTVIVTNVVQSKPPLDPNFDGKPFLRFDGLERVRLVGSETAALPSDDS